MSPRIQKVWCECLGGNALCSHMAATMFHAHYNISSTDQLCSWLSKTPSRDPIPDTNTLYSNPKPIAPFSQ